MNTNFKPATKIVMKAIPSCLERNAGHTTLTARTQFYMCPGACASTETGRTTRFSWSILIMYFLRGRPNSTISPERKSSETVRFLRSWAGAAYSRHGYCMRQQTGIDTDFAIVVFEALAGNFKPGRMQACRYTRNTKQETSLRSVGLQTLQWARSKDKPGKIKSRSPLAMHTMGHQRPYNEPHERISEPILHPYERYTTCLYISKRTVARRHCQEQKSRTYRVFVPPTGE